MPKKKPAPVALSLRAVVPIARGTGATGDAPGWTGNDVAPGDTLTITATRDDGSSVDFDVRVALNTPVEVEYYRHGGILHYVLRDFLNNALELA